MSNHDFTDEKLQEIYVAAATDANVDAAGLNAVAEAVHIKAWNDALESIQAAIIQNGVHFQTEEFGRLMKVLDVFDFCRDKKIVNS